MHKEEQAARSLLAMLQDLNCMSTRVDSSHPPDRVVVLKQIIAALANDLLDPQVPQYIRPRMVNEFRGLDKIEAYADSSEKIHRLPHSNPMSDEEREIRKRIRDILENTLIQ